MIIKQWVKEEDGTSKEHEFKIGKNMKGRFTCTCLTNGSDEFSVGTNIDRALRKYIITNFEGEKK